MTKENKFKIGLALQGIALSMDNATLERNRDRLKQIEDIIIAETIGEQEPFNIETYCIEHFCVMVDKDVWEKAEKALKQEPKTGKWRQIGYDIYECSICGQDVMTGDICAYRHCHCCGTRMVSPQESEDK